VSGVPVFDASTPANAGTMDVIEPLPSTRERSLRRCRSESTATAQQGRDRPDARSRLVQQASPRSDRNRRRTNAHRLPDLAPARRVQSGRSGALRRSATQACTTFIGSLAERRAAKGFLSA
jgi:hypothetical protein